MNLIGTILVWKFVEPSPIKILKGVVATMNTATIQEAIKKAPKHRKFTKIGLTLISLGFLCQLIAVSL